MGFPWKRRTQVDAHRNNIVEVADYLERRYGEHYMVFNLSDKHDVQYHHFNYQALEFDTDAPCPALVGSSNTPSLDQLFRICYAIQFWLDLDPKNVAVVHCTTGRLRTGLVLACYLVYSG